MTKDNSLTTGSRYVYPKNTDGPQKNRVLDGPGLCDDACPSCIAVTKRGGGSTEGRRLSTGTRTYDLRHVLQLRI